MHRVPGEEDRPLSSDPEVLRLTLADLQCENQRLRAARASVTSQLGPLPISTAIVAGLIGGFTATGSAHLNHTLVALAAVPFALMVAVSIAYGAIRPYRKLRDSAERALRPSARATLEEYYRDAIRIEEAVRGSSLDADGRTVGTLRPVWPWRAETLQEAFDAEWQGLFITKVLFVIAIALLVGARIV
ncbi:MAG TPA: hypothetical protein VH115_04920 [Solirubrobacteraceae bacterium]|nr:hypothetical protein [Solirubrobacteraceae bacterium]